MQRSESAHLARAQEEEMNRDARLMSGILLITVPTIQYGGYFLLRLFSGQMPGMKPSPLQASFFRAGHAHAGVLVILSLICQIFVEHAALGPGFTWLVRIGVPLAAILIPLGFFLSVAFTPDRPNEWIRSLYAGALVLALSVIVLGVGLIRA
jgi:hypothetical protein